MIHGRRYFAILCIAALAGCWPLTVTVPELDSQRHKFQRLVGLSKAEVERQIGDPAQKTRDRDGREVWVFAVRGFAAPSTGGVPLAAILRVQFDSAGAVGDWFFLDPHRKTKLPINESLAEARDFLRSFCFEKRTEVDLEQIEVGDAKEDVAKLLNRATVLGRDIRRESVNATGVAWDYYVDRPSPVFIPPFYETLVFDEEGVVNQVYGSEYGGCAD